MNKLKVGETSHHKVIENESVINLFDISGLDNFDYIVNENSSLTLNIFSVKNLDLKINVNLLENSKLNINVSFICYDNFNLNVNIFLKGNNILSNLSVRGINKGEKVKILLNGEDMKDLNGNIINEYAKIINYSDNENILIPNLLVNSFGVTANHGVSIGTFNSDALFYLESKGINKNDALKLLEEGFIFYNLNNEEKMKIKKILGGEI